MGMLVYNGLTEGETRRSKHRRRKQDNGHSVVETGVTHVPWLRLRYHLVCECGARYTSRTDIATVYRTWGRHAAKATGAASS